MSTLKSPMRLLWIFGLILLLSICAIDSVHAKGYSFISISFPVLPFGQNTSAEGINDKGVVVGNYQCSSGGTCAYRWSHRDFRTLHVPGALNSTLAFGVNNAGDIVGAYSAYTSPSAPQVIGFMMRGDTVTDIIYPGAAFTWAYGINDLGQVVGGYRIDSNRPQMHGFLLSNGVFTTIDFPGSAFTLLGGINDSGQIVGHYNLGKIAAGFLFDGTFTSFGPRHGLVSSVGDINNAGVIVGDFYFESQAPTGFVLTGNEYTIISFPGSIQTQVYGINNLGQIVGQYRNEHGDYFGFLATPR